MQLFTGFAVKTVLGVLVSIILYLGFSLVQHKNAIRDWKDKEAAAQAQVANLKAEADAANKVLVKTEQDAAELRQSLQELQTLYVAQQAETKRLADAAKIRSTQTKRKIADVVDENGPIIAGDGRDSLLGLLREHRQAITDEVTGTNTSRSGSGGSGGAPSDGLSAEPGPAGASGSTPGIRPVVGVQPRCSCRQRGRYPSVGQVACRRTNQDGRLGACTRQSIEKLAERLARPA